MQIMTYGNVKFVPRAKILRIQHTLFALIGPTKGWLLNEGWACGEYIYWLRTHVAKTTKYKRGDTLYAKIRDNDAEFAYFEFHQVPYLNNELNSKVTIWRKWYFLLVAFFFLVGLIFFTRIKSTYIDKVTIKFWQF